MTTTTTQALADSIRELVAREFDGYSATPIDTPNNFGGYDFRTNGHTVRIATEDEQVVSLHVFRGNMGPLLSTARLFNMPAGVIAPIVTAYLH